MIKLPGTTAMIRYRALMGNDVCLFYVPANAVSLDESDEELNQKLVHIAELVVVESTGQIIKNQFGNVT